VREVDIVLVGDACEIKPLAVFVPGKAETRPSAIGIDETVDLFSRLLDVASQS